MWTFLRYEFGEGERERSDVTVPLRSLFSCVLLRFLAQSLSVTVFVFMLLLSFLVTVSSLVLDGSGSVFICS